MKLLAKEQQESHKNAKISYIPKEKFENKLFKNEKNIAKLKTIVTTQESIGVLRIAYVI